jgi:hypothetical protein
MDPADTVAVSSLKEKDNTNVGSVRKMLGLLGYYRKYVPSFSRRARILYDLLKTPEELEISKKKKTKKKKDQLNQKKKSIRTAVKKTADQLDSRPPKSPR